MPSLQARPTYFHLKGRSTCHLVRCSEHIIHTEFASLTHQHLTSVLDMQLHNSKFGHRCIQVLDSKVQLPFSCKLPNKLLIVLGSVNASTVASVTLLLLSWWSATIFCKICMCQKVSDTFMKKAVCHRRKLLSPCLTHNGTVVGQRMAIVRIVQAWVNWGLQFWLGMICRTMRYLYQTLLNFSSQHLPAWVCTSYSLQLFIIIKEEVKVLPGHIYIQICTYTRDSQVNLMPVTFSST